MSAPIGDNSLVFAGAVGSLGARIEPGDFIGEIEDSEDDYGSFPGENSEDTPEPQSADLENSLGDIELETRAVG